MYRGRGGLIEISPNSFNMVTPMNMTEQTKDLHVIAAGVYCCGIRYTTNQVQRGDDKGLGDECWPAFAICRVVDPKPHLTNGAIKLTNEIVVYVNSTTSDDRYNMQYDTEEEL